MKAGFRKGRGTRDQIANIHWITKKARAFQKTICSASLTVPKPVTVWVPQTAWEILQEVGTPGHLSCLLGNLYAGRKAAVRVGHRTTDWFQKEHVKAVHSHPAY